MALVTRPLTGKTSWPVLCIAGMEQTGKTYRSIQASASTMIGRTFLIVVGEDVPEEYALIAGSRAELVEHDGTYRGVLNAVTDAVNEPPEDPAKPNLVILDSGTRVWNLLSEQAQKSANERMDRKHANGKGPARGEEEADIGRDLWNTATDRWYHILDTLRSHQGPVIITARLDLVSGTLPNGQPSKEKEWKVQAQKYLPYDVTATVQMREYGKAVLTGVKSVKLKRDPAAVTPLPSDWSVEWLWKALGLEDVKSIGDRPHASIKAQGADEERRGLLEQIAAAADAAGVPRQDVANQWAETHNGQPIAEATDLGGLELLRDDLTARANAQEGTAA